MAWANYKNLVVWQKAMDLTDAVYSLTKALPPDERFALSDQMKRAAVSVPSNIAEGYGRHTNKEFRQFLSYARGSVFEIETQITICLRQHYLSEKDVKNALALCDEVGKILTGLSNNTRNDKN